MFQLRPLVVLLVGLPMVPTAWAAYAQEPENLARHARVTVSSALPAAPKEAAVDGRMDTFWGSAAGKVADHWIQFDWDQPQKVCGLTIHQNGSHADAFDAQVNKDGKWASVGRAGGCPLPALVKIPIVPQAATSLRLAVHGTASLSEVEIYGDRAGMEKVYRPEIAVSGDLLGHLIGTFSDVDGSVGVEDAAVTATGSTPNGEWTRTAKSAADGFFQIDLPFGARGPIEITATKGDTSKTLTLDGSDISRQLTPRPAPGTAERISLEGKWDLALDPPSEFLSETASLKWSPINVPAHWVMEGFESKSGVGLYRKTLAIPGEWAGKRIKLRAEGIYSKAEVWLNGQRIGGHLGGATPFELDLTDAAKAGASNDLLIRVTASSSASRIDNMSFYAYFELAGIWRPIEIFAVEPVHVSRLAIDTSFDREYRDADLTAAVNVANEGPQAAGDAMLHLRVLDAKGRELPL